MKILADETILQDVTRLKIDLNGREYILSEQNGKLHLIKDSTERLQVEPLSTNSIDII